MTMGTNVGATLLLLAQKQNGSRLMDGQHLHKPLKKYEKETNEATI
jgi:hypothetical protein